MILDQITLENFGVYRDRQVITLTPLSREKPIVLFGGLNGGGKTTLLDALHLVLYGKAAHCSNRGSQPYEEYLRRSIHKKASVEDGASIELKFRRTVSGNEQTYTVCRSWSQNGSAMREKLDVLVNDVPDQVLSETWAEHIEAFIPHGISDLFFFDGEKIEDMANTTNASKALSTAIHSLLGLDLVDRLTADLSVLERRKRSASKSEAERVEIEALQAEVSRLRETYETVFLERGAAQNELESCQKKVRQLEEQFRLEGGDLATRREQILSDRNVIEAQLIQVANELRELAAGPAPFLLVEDLLTTIERQDQAEYAIHENQLLREVLDDRDAQLLETLRAARAPKNVLRATEEFYRTDREERHAKNSTPCYLKLDTDGREILRSLRRFTLRVAQTRSQQFARQADELQEKLTSIDRQIVSIPEQGSLEHLAGQIKEAQQFMNEAQARTEILDAKLSQLRNEQGRKNSQLVGLLEREVEGQIREADDTRVLRYSQKTRNTLQAFRVTVVRNHISRIEGLIVESLRQLLRKESLVSEVHICPDDFAITLRDFDGRTIPPDRLSAGERQLLAVSILWGLARASGRPLPTIIDTPLGRLDAMHRMHLVDRYFPRASHQVILLSTDKEIDRKFYERLKPRIGRAYRLTFDDVTQSTKAEKGYFW